MSNTPNRSWAKVVQGQKRNVQEQLANLTRTTKKGPFVPTEGWLNFVTSEHWFKDLSRALPKSSMPHGIRVNFKGDPAIFQEAAKAVKDVYPGAVSLHQSPLKDFFDLGFSTKEDADQASLKKLVVDVTDPKGKVNTHTLATTRTRYNQDKTLFVSFESLPLDMPREEVKAQLKSGLEQYGEIVQFELLKNPYMAHLTTAKAMALINPHTEEDIKRIPRRATMEKGDGTRSSEFKVFPEMTPPICALCHAIGHREGLCPTTVSGVQAAAEDEGKDAQDPIQPGTQANALVALPWGTGAEYKVIAPITNRQKKAHAKSTHQGPQPMDNPPQQMEPSQAPQNEVMEPCPMLAPPAQPTESDDHAIMELADSVINQSWAEAMDEAEPQPPTEMQVMQPPKENQGLPKSRGKTTRPKRSSTQSKLSEVLKPPQYSMEAERTARAPKKAPSSTPMEEGGPTNGGTTLA